MMFQFSNLDDQSYNDPVSWLIMFGHLTEGLGLTMIDQMAQNCRAGRFQYYDYGPQRNIEEYGTEAVPEIPLQNINLPVAVFTSLHDRYSPPESTDWLVDQLGDNIVFHQSYEYSHYSYFVARDVSYLEDIVPLLESYSQDGANDE